MHGLPDIQQTLANQKFPNSVCSWMRTKSCQLR